MADFNSGTSTVATDPTFEAKGDLLVGTADDTGTVLSVGTSNYLLSVTDDTPAWTNTPTVGSLTTTGGIELGNASDTTITRGAAGLLEVENVRLVTVSATQTLTYKTLTSPTLTDPALGTPASGILTNATGLPEAGLLDDAVTLAKMAGGTAGQIITYDGSGDPAAVGPGTNGQVLTSTGSGSPPAFEDAGGGGRSIGFILAMS